MRSRVGRVGVLKKEYDKGEQPTIHKDRLYYLVPRYRVIKNWNIIEDFISLKNKARLYWNDDVICLFDKVSHVFAEIRISSTILYTGIKEQKTIEDLEKKIWEYPEKDPIKKYMHNIVEEFIMEDLHD